MWEIDTVTAVATVVLDYTDADYDFGGLDYDPASGLFYATNDDATPFGSGVYSLDVFGTGAITFIASYPPGETDIDGCAVGGGKVWLIEDEPSPLHNLDLTTLLYDPAPPMSPMTASAVFSGGSWAPGLGGSSLPEFFCTAKTTLVCGTPAIGFTGSPSATSTSGFVVSAGPARTCKSGILLYNTAQVTPGVAFQGGTLCVEPMGLRRAGSTNSMGTPGGTNCDGSFSIDMNAFANALWVVPDCAGAPSGLAPNTPAGYLLNMGQDVFCQYWGRDSVASGSFVSDGLHYQVGP